MKNVFIILKHNLKSIMKNWFWLVLIFPIVVNGFLYALINKIDKNNENTFTIRVYTEDKGEVFEKLIPKEKFREIEEISSKEELKNLVENDEISVGVIINSQDIYTDLKNNKKDTIEILARDGDMKGEQVANIINNSILQLTSFGNNKEEALKAFEEYEKSAYTFDYKSSKLEENLGYVMVFGMFCMGFVFIAGRGVSPLLKEKEISIDKRILVSKVSKGEYMCGHILGCFLLLMAQSLTLVSTFYIVNSDFAVSIWWMLVLSIALCFVGVALALFVLSISNNTTTYYSLLSVIVTPMALLSGGFIPLELMPETVQKISLISPLTWVNTAFKNILFGESFGIISLNLLAAVAISVVFAVLFIIIESRKKTA